MRATLTISIGTALIAGYYLYGYLAGDSQIAHSNISNDEHVVFFNTTAWLDEASRQWQVPIHGWVYEPQDSSARKSAFARILEEEFELEATAETESNFADRLNLLIADNERGKIIVIDIAGRTVELPPSEANGHFETLLTFPAGEIEAYADDSIVKFSMVTGANDRRAFGGEVRLVGPVGLSIISDIDDTIKVSAVTDRRKLLDHTFFLDFVAVPGMASRYSNWANQDASLHFVSSSPWQLYSPLSEFMDAAGFPWSSLNLKQVRFRDETLFDLFKKGTETKPHAIRLILNAYPNRDFVLVGDSGEQDPEVYASLLKEYPDQVRKIYIRNVTDESSDDERFSVLFDGVEKERWLLFDDPVVLDP
ncbi:MAG: phosphatidate phosphatase App1 family protein [Gammaproteobacteria bacterium]